MIFSLFQVAYPREAGLQLSVSGDGMPFDETPISTKVLLETGLFD